jgi:hypothetical protein
LEVLQLNPEDLKTKLPVKITELISVSGKNLAAAFV